MNRKAFGQLLERYQNNECTDSERKLVEYWYSLLEKKPTQELKEEQNKRLDGKVWEQIYTHTTQKSTQIPEPVFLNSLKNKHRSAGYWLRIAASFILLVAAGFIWYTQSFRLFTNSAKEFVIAGWVKRVNETSQPLMIRLTDGSRVTLTPGSSLQYPKQFTPEKREIQLSGKAFFEVQKSPSQPFYVYTGEVVTKVLGTSFYVNAASDARQVEVEVVSGRVAVFEQGNPEQKPAVNGVVLQPNHKVTYFSRGKHFVTGLVDQPELIRGESRTENSTNHFRFEDASLGTVVITIEKAYGVDIVTDNETLNQCLLTADLTSQPLFTQLDMICSALKLSYTVQGTSIVISGTGCGESSEENP